jgi:hypothetical protein
MSYHFGANEYNHLIGLKIGEDWIIQNIEYSPDNIYISTDGYYGKPYLLFLYNGYTFHNFQFRQFQEVIDIYGQLVR